MSRAMKGVGVDVTSKEGGGVDVTNKEGGRGGCHEQGRR